MMLIMSRSPGQLTGFLSAFLTFLSSPLPSEVGGRLAKAALQPSPTTHQPATMGSAPVWPQHRVAATLAIVLVDTLVHATLLHHGT